MLTLAFSPLAANQPSTYDPWLDYNEDGIIDANDLQPLGQAYGSSGDSTKNVSVTNWPVAQELFPENLILRAAYYYSAGWYKRDLFDATTTSPSPSENVFPSDSVFVPINTTIRLIYNNTFTYQKIPTSDYRILGTPTVALTWNVTTLSPTTPFTIAFEVYLGKIFLDGTWEQVALLGGFSKWYPATPLTDNKATHYFSMPLVVDTIIYASTRLAIRVLAYGTSGSLTDLMPLEILLGAETDDFIVDVPIVKNP